MSDTPRTDEVLDMYYHARGTMLAKLAKELERELNAAKQERADFGALVDKLERELNAAKAEIEAMKKALQSIYLDDIFDATMREIAKEALAKLK